MAVKEDDIGVERVSIDIPGVDFDNTYLHATCNAPPTYSSPQISESRQPSPALTIQTESKANTEDLPPLDTGFRAWKVLCGAVFVEGTLLAFPLTFGVFQDYLTRPDTLFLDAQCSWIGVLGTGVPFLGAPVMTHICQRYRLPRQRYIWLGWAICVIGLISASFCRSLAPLALTQGLLYGVGVFILDIPVLLVLNTWFVERRGVAYGILFGAGDLIGFGMAFLAQGLLHRYGFRVTLLIFAAIMFTVPGASIWLLRERPTSHPTDATGKSPDSLPTSPATRYLSVSDCPSLEATPNNIDQCRYYRQPLFYLLIASNLLQSLAFYLPFIYLPSYATSLGLPSHSGATVLAIANFAQILGELAFGKLSDLLPVTVLVLLSSIMACITTLALWGLAQNLAQLIAFAVLFGAFASGFISLWARMGTLFGGRDAQNVYSAMSVGRGIGNIASGPISSALLGGVAKDRKTGRHLYANGRYGGVVVFVGVCMAGSALFGVVGMCYASATVSKRKECPQGAELAEGVKV